MSFLHIFRIPAAIGLLIVLSAVLYSAGHDSADARQLDESTVSGDAQPQGATTLKYDWNIDGCPDFIDTYQDHLELWKGVCLGATWNFMPPVQMAIETTVYDRFLLPGRWDADTCPDMIATRGGLLYLFRGDCSAGFIGDLPTQIGEGFEIFDILLGGRVNTVGCADLLGRRLSDGALLRYRGDCNVGFTGNAEVISSGWDMFDWMNAPGGTAGVCPDLLGRKINSGDLRLYTGACTGTYCCGNFENIVKTGMVEFDHILSGGNWAYAGAEICPDLIGYKSVDPTKLYMFPGNCTGGYGDAQVVSSDGFSPPFAAEAVVIPHQVVWGDNDCSNAAAPRDAQAGLSYFLETDALSQTDPCADVGRIVTVNRVSVPWGDWDCSGNVAPRDGQAVLAAFLEKPALTQTEPCPDIETNVVLG